MAYLKRKMKDIVPKNQRFLQAKKLMNEVPDEKYLMVKVATILESMGATLRKELRNLLHIELRNRQLVVQILNTKTKINQSFCIVGKYVDYCCSASQFFFEIFEQQMHC